MSGLRLAEFLNRHRKLGLDTSVFIYAVEENPKYLALVRPILAWVEGPKGQAVTSTVSMLELLVQPYRLSDLNRVNQFYALLITYPHLEWVAPSLAVADRAARLRADHNLKTPDALQAATALASEATGFISNDPAYKRVAGIETVILDELEAENAPSTS
ncbi:MAG TPA: PIN domain-containing protein [Vicinamibacteria bacterium]|nr:PIN domain-containing protein [Vicinamibacteria bacterium]